MAGGERPQAAAQTCPAGKQPAAALQKCPAGKQPAGASQRHPAGMPRAGRRRGENAPTAAARAWIELDKAALQNNVLALQSLLPPACRLMPAVKANAYGHGAALIAGELQRLGVRAFCVASAPEGVQLRRCGIRGDILILGYTPPQQLALLRRFRLTQTVIDAAYARQLDAFGKKLRVHLKLDTGMHRLGERTEHLQALCGVFACKNLVVTGCFTHLCAAAAASGAGRAGTQRQAQAFFDTVAQLKERGCRCGRLHMLASAGLLHYPAYALDAVRPGLALYGVLDSRAESLHCPVRLAPVLALKARVALTKELYAGEGAGYAPQYVAKTDGKIAVLPIGYADGVPRALSGAGGRVLIRGAFAPIVGPICMDQLLVDITGIPGVQSGDEAVLLGADGKEAIPVYEWAEKCDTIPNEILSRLGGRLQRLWRPAP